MCSWEKTGDRVAMVQMNADLRHAQLELLSAQCATDRLRLRFSTADIARHAQRDVLSKALLSATALHDFYSFIARQVDDPESLLRSGASRPSEDRIAADISRLTRYLREQRDLFLPEAVPLGAEHREPLAGSFPSQFLDKIRIVVLEARRVSAPPFFAEIRSLGFTNLPDFAHMSSLTFEDLIVFQNPIDSRRLFHALVHAMQFEVLGRERYTELFARAFIRMRSYITVPLETHALILESKFAADPAHPFSVEEKVRLWVNERRYEQF